MDKRDFFLKALAAGSYRYKRWVLEAFSTTQQKDVGNFPYALLRKEDGSYWFHNPENDNALETIGTFPENEAPFHFREELVLAANTLPNQKRSITTTYGNVLANQIVLVHAFGDKVDYIEGRMSVAAIEKMIQDKIRDTPAPGEPRDPKFIYVDEYKRFNDAVLSLAGYTTLCVPTATERSLTTDPQIAVRRKELMEQYKDQLNDPVIQARIDAELIAMDRAWLKGDPSEGFFIKSKSYEIVRKKTHLLQGAESGFGKTGELIDKPLSEGWTPDNLPAMANALRSGSFNRGAQTALGGEAAKFNYRIFQNTTINEEDCGSKIGLPVLLDEQNSRFYISSSIISGEKTIELTDENIQQYIGKTVQMRSPGFCQSKGTNFCKVCVGQAIAKTPTALSTYAADIGSIFLGLFLKSMHGKALTLVPWDHTRYIR